MLFTYKLSDQQFSSSFAAFFSQSRLLFSSQLYKASFVISRRPGIFVSALFGNLLITHFLYSMWYRQSQNIVLTINDRRSKTHAISPVTGIGRALRITRLYLLQFGQRRVCNHSLVWLTEDIWATVNFDTHNVWFRPKFETPARYTYRHLHASEIFNAGIMLIQPNYYLFVYLLTNPYFWLVLQQTLNSQYRH